MFQNFRILPISAAAALPLRAAILRPGQPIENSKFPLDPDTRSFHLGFFSAEQELCGVATFHSETTHVLSGTNPYRLRGMAVAEKYHRHGVGRALLIDAESTLKERKCDLLWFNARVSAFAFYENLQFRAVGDLFEIPSVGLHKVMYKRL
jgi:GNAT superfamily N-acetyltransferase